MKLTKDEIVELQTLLIREIGDCVRNDDYYFKEKEKKLRVIEKKLRDEWVFLELK